LLSKSFWQNFRKVPFLRKDIGYISAGWVESGRDHEAKGGG
jgi:hypothetical protein